MTRIALTLTLFLVASVSGLLGLLAGGGGVVRTSLPRPVAGGPPSFADIVQRVNPAVVHIAVIEAGRTNPHEGIEDAPELDVPQRGEGSGFIVDPQGYILTNHHLVPAPGRIRVRMADKREFPAVLVGADASTDLALVKVTAEGLPTVPLGDSDRLRVGEWVCAIGNPLHFDHTVTVGVVSSKGRKIFDLSFDSYIQTDAAINPGNSGGPLINGYGEAVGINSAVSSEGQGIGFAVPINVAKGILDQLRTHGRVSRGYLGIQLQELDPDLQRLIGLREAKGAVILDVVKGGAGDAAGLRRYDVITAVSGRKIEDDDELVRTISSLQPGSDVHLSVFRDGRDISLEAQLEERSEGEPAASTTQAQPADTAPVGDPLGLVVQDLPPRTKRTLRIPPERAGVVVKDVLGLDPGTDVLDHGDIIVEVNRRPTPDAKTYRRVVGGLRPGDKAWLYVYRPRPAGTFLTKIEVDTRR